MPFPFPFDLAFTTGRVDVLIVAFAGAFAAAVDVALIAEGVEGMDDAKGELPIKWDTLGTVVELEGGAADAASGCLEPVLPFPFAAPVLPGVGVYRATGAIAAAASVALGFGADVDAGVGACSLSEAIARPGL